MLSCISKMWKQPRKRQHSTLRNSSLFSRAFIIPLFLLCGCGPNNADHRDPPGSNVTTGQFNVAPRTELGDNHSGCSSPGPLRALWEQRTEVGGPYDFPVGPGDVLHVQVADLQEYQDLTVRVGGDGTINLPLVGTMSVNGMSVDQLHNAIATRISEYVTHPRVHAYVSQYHSRSVAVMGMVAKPGAYSLAGPSDSILDIIGRAGGVREGAAQKVVLFPVESNGDSAGGRASGALACADEPFNLGGSSEGARDCRLAAASAATDREGPDSTEEISNLKKDDAIVIDLTAPTLTGCLDIPARPGDVVLIPAAGQVGVYGWVQKPGTFDVTPGMTVLGAVTAAGGAMYSSNAEILRTASTGQRTVVPIDLSNVESGDKPDIPVEAGDLVLVRASALGLVPYTFTTLLSKFGSGMYFAP